MSRYYVFFERLRGFRVRPSISLKKHFFNKKIKLIYTGLDGLDPI